MTTTVQVREDTRRLLDKLKRQLSLASYDDVIRNLLKSKTGQSESFFGACTGSYPFVREKEDEHGI
jgi:predicted CopG family antitoxin